MGGRLASGVLLPSRLNDHAATHEAAVDHADVLEALLVRRLLEPERVRILVESEVAPHTGGFEVTCARDLAVAVLVHAARLQLDLELARGAAERRLFTGGRVWPRT